MTPTPTLAAIRFGAGLSPDAARLERPDQLLPALDLPDVSAEAYPVRSFAYWRNHALDRRASAAKPQKSDPDALRDLDRARNRAIRRDLAASLARAAYGPSGFRERLTLFWANHFTTAARGAFRAPSAAHADEAIRPNLTGSFSELLRAAILHPAMLYYLDQARSAGPNSRSGLARKRGLNENLARELLELHTLGAAGDYSQADVENLALLLTGATFTLEDGFVFRRGMAEPGARVLLGRTYARPKPRLADIETALDDIARHPDTARHVATRLATHFVADDPDPALVSHLEARFLESDGALTEVYAALLEHPAAWTPDLGKVRPPFDFVVAAIRALGVPPEGITGLDGQGVGTLFVRPMRAMGQPFQQAPDAAGWPDRGEAWITPPTLAARIQWAMTVPRRLTRQPDPQTLVEVALAEAADDDLRSAAARAESRWDGAGVVLASPAFNRR